MACARRFQVSSAIAVLGLASVCLADATVAASQPASVITDWVERFSFSPPQSDASGLCLPGDRSLPTFTVTPAGTGRQTVRVSLPFAPGSLPAEVGLILKAGDRPIEPDVQVLTLHPGRPRSVRRAMVTFAYDFADSQPVTFACGWKADRGAC